MFWRSQSLSELGLHDKTIRLRPHSHKTKANVNVANVCQIWIRAIRLQATSLSFLFSHSLVIGINEPKVSQRDLVCTAGSIVPLVVTVFIWIFGTMLPTDSKLNYPFWTILTTSGHHDIRMWTIIGRSPLRLRLYLSERLIDTAETVSARVLSAKLKPTRTETKTYCLLNSDIKWVSCCKISAPCRHKMAWDYDVTVD